MTDAKLVASMRVIDFCLDEIDDAHHDAGEHPERTTGCAWCSFIEQTRVAMEALTGGAVTP
jgi:hypothetical protein